MVITEKQAANIKKIMETLYKYGYRQSISKLEDYNTFKEFSICYNEAASSTLNKSVISFVYFKDFYIDSQCYFTKLNKKEFLSFMKDNNSFQYITKVMKEGTEIQFLAWNEFADYEKLLSKVAQLSLTKKLTNEEIISNFKDSEIAYLYRYKGLFIDDMNGFLELCENT